MSIIAQFICIQGGEAYEHRYELKTASNFELMLCIAQTGNDYCEYCRRPEMQAEIDLLAEKCAKLQKKIKDLSSAETRDMNAINACSAELSGHSQHYKAKLAKYNKSMAFYNGLTSVYLRDDEDELERMLFCTNIIYREFFIGVEKFMHNAFDVFKCDGNNLLVKSNFIDVPKEEKPITAAELIELTKPKTAIPALEKQAKKQAKTPLVIKPVRQ
jgi:hypothetical protein